MKNQAFLTLSAVPHLFCVTCEAFVVTNRPWSRLTPCPTSSQGLRTSSTVFASVVEDTEPQGVATATEESDVKDVDTVDVTLEEDTDKESDKEPAESEESSSTLSNYKTLFEMKESDSYSPAETATKPSSSNASAQQAAAKPRINNTTPPTFESRRATWNASSLNTSTNDGLLIGSVRPSDVFVSIGNNGSSSNPISASNQGRITESPRLDGQPSMMKADVPLSAGVKPIIMNVDEPLATVTKPSIMKADVPLNSGVKPAFMNEEPVVASGGFKPSIMNADVPLNSGVKPSSVFETVAKKKGTIRSPGASLSADETVPVPVNTPSEPVLKRKRTTKVATVGAKENKSEDGSSNADNQEGKVSEPSTGESDVMFRANDPRLFRIG